MAETRGIHWSACFASMFSSSHEWAFIATTPERGIITIGAQTFE